MCRELAARALRPARVGRAVAGDRRQTAAEHHIGNSLAMELLPETGRGSSASPLPVTALTKAPRCPWTQLTFMAVAYAGTALFFIFAGKFTLSLGLKESTYNLVTLDYLDQLFQAPPLLATASYIVALEGTNHLGAAETEVARRQPRVLASRPSALEVASVIFPPVLLYSLTAFQHHWFYNAYTHERTVSDWLEDTSAIIAMLLLFKVVLVVRTMLLQIPGRECAERARSMVIRGWALFLIQFFFTLMLSWNMMNTPPMMSPLMNHELPAGKPCNGSMLNHTKLQYHQCICGGIDPHYLKHDCNLTAGVDVNSQWQRRGSSTYGPFICNDERDWLPYNNRLTACMALTSHYSKQFLHDSAIYLSYGMLAIWIVAEYEVLGFAENQRRGKKLDRLSAVVHQVGRVCWSLFTLIMIAYATVPFTAYDWLNIHDTSIGLTNTGEVKILWFSLGLVGSLATAFDALRKKLAELRNPVQNSRYDCFLTHDWGTDELGRSNHDRVSQVNRLLQASGLVTWFDEERMEGNINQQMAHGIDGSKAVVVFITRRYMQKVGGEGERGDDDNW